MTRRSLPRILVAILLGFTARPVAAAEAAVQERLCAGLLEAVPDARALGRALDAGADPDLPCPVTRRDMHLRFEALFILFATGGAGALVPGWLGPPAWKEHIRVHPVPPLALASALRRRDLVDRLMAGGADPGGLQAEVGMAVAQGELAWAEYLSALGADRRIALIPSPLLRPPYLDRLLAMDPDLSLARIDWETATSRFDAHPEMLDALLSAGLPTGALRGAFEVAVAEGRLDWAAEVAAAGERRLRRIPDAILADPERLATLAAMQPGADVLIHFPSGQLSTAARSNPQLLAQLEAAGIEPLEVARGLLGQGDVQSLKALVAQGLDLDARPRADGRAPLLSSAVSRRAAQEVEILLSLGARAVTAGPDHPVRLALHNRDVELALMLIETATPEDERQQWWYAAAEAGVGADDRALIAAALAAGRGHGRFDLSPLMAEALRWPTLGTVPLLVAASRDPARAAQAGLRAAVDGGRDDAIPLLLELGADPSGRTEPDGDPPLHRAVSGWRYAQGLMVAALLEAGADVHGQDRAGRTPLERAVSESCWRCVAPLVEGGARVEAETISEILSIRYPTGEQVEAVLALLATEVAAGRLLRWRQLRAARRNGWPVAVIEALSDS